MSLNEFLRRHDVQLVLASGISAAAGVVSSAIITKKRLKEKYAALASEEIAEAKRFYAMVHKQPPFDTPTGALNVLGANHPALNEAAEALLVYQGVETDPDDTEEAVIDGDSFNVFDQPQFDYEEYNRSRGDSEPYIITDDVYMRNDESFEQVTVTYYEGDGVLSDERDVEIQNIDESVGNKNLELFGILSNDENIVYVHNPNTGIDYEIVRSKGKYSEEVAGFIEHSDWRPSSRDKRRQNRRFKLDED